MLLALVLFLWTPPHFWSLAIANKADYAQAGVPMLPVVVGTERAARIVLGSTVALFVACCCRWDLAPARCTPWAPWWGCTLCTSRGFW